MSLTDAFNAEVKNPCTFCAWLETQPEAERKEINDWLLNGGQAVIVWRVCTRDRGLAVSETTVRNHRRKCLKGVR